jgi:hypothetical protein
MPVAVLHPERQHDDEQGRRQQEDDDPCGTPGYSHVPIQYREPDTGKLAPAEERAGFRREHTLIQCIEGRALWKL